MGEIVDAFRTAFDGCGPHCGHHADMVELRRLAAANVLLDKTVMALRDQKEALQAEIARLNAELRSLR